MKTDAEQLVIGREVDGYDGSFGTLVRVVIDPIERTLTHLVVEPHLRPGQGRLVPIDLVDATSTPIELECTAAEFDCLETVEATRFLPGSSRRWGYQPDQWLSWPYYALALGGMLAGGVGVLPAVGSHRVPAGEVEIRRGDHVHATDGAIGRVQGLVIDRTDHHMTHVLLEEGHLWGVRQVAIPAAAVADIDDGVRLTLTKDEVRDLPLITVEQS
jgi:sporulation protein YlmC with PRC-barrel domain